jgi:predicted nucleic acid-binding protein
MMYCFDSSAVVKRYAPETGSAWVKRIVAAASEDTIYLGQVGILEIAAALSRKVRTHELSHADYEATLWLFLTDVRNEAYVMAPLSDRIVELAVDLTGRHPLRGYDAVHLATAMTLSTALLEADLSPLVFVAADVQLCEAAQGEELSTENPNAYA